MKIIVSHDVDHLTVWEHSFDLVLLKFIARAVLECGFGKISSGELAERLKCFKNNKWENIEELMSFDKTHNVPATYFVGVARGKGMCYSLERAEYWVKRILANGFDAGVHGIAYNSEASIQEEYRIFKKISGLDQFGIRMHYLRNDQNTLDLLGRAGYAFDATINDLQNPFKIGDMWEFPISAMDGRLLQNKKIAQKPDFKTVQKNTLRIIEQSQERGNLYFSLLFHDRYFSDAFQTFKFWYSWLITYLKGEGYQFVSYLEAIRELNR
jgi:peptidoglycan/xylan/chitin deacetylase (PgdA/CDA1 family)